MIKTIVQFSAFREKVEDRFKKKKSLKDQLDHSASDQADENLGNSSDALFIDKINYQIKVREILDKYRDDENIPYFKKDGPILLPLLDWIGEIKETLDSGALDILVKFEKKDAPGNISRGAVDYALLIHYRFQYYKNPNEEKYADEIDNYIFDEPYCTHHSKVFEYVNTEAVETAPFKWPDHISEQDAHDPNALEGIWLNPHNHFSLPLSGRTDEKELLTDFVEDDRKFLIAALIAPSGAGKTRLVSEWMRDYMAKYNDNGWDAGFVESRSKEPWEGWKPKKSTIIIIDYTYNYDDVMRVIYQRFKGGVPENEDLDIRVLVLDHVTRQFDQMHNHSFWRQVASEGGELGARGNKASGDFFDPYPIELKPEGKRSELLHDVIAYAANRNSTRCLNRESAVVIRAFQALMSIGETSDAVLNQDQIRRQNSVRHPLFAALVGQVIANDPGETFTGWSRRDLITQYFERWRRIPWRADERNKYAETIGPWVGCIVSAATLLRGFQIARTPELIKAEVSDYGLNPFSQICNQIVSGDDDFHIKPLEPDILGEAFFLKFVEHHFIDDEKLNSLAAAMSNFSSDRSAEPAVASFLETMQRLVRNLVNDDQTIAPVRNSWNALANFLKPVRFTENRLMRQAVSIALGDIVKQCREVGLDDQLHQFAGHIVLDDLREISGSAFWEQSATSTIHYIDWLATGNAVEEIHEEKLVHILQNFKENSENKWPALMLAAYEGCLNTAKTVRRLFGEDVNSTQSQGWTILMIAAYNGHAQVVEWLMNEGADPTLARHESGGTAMLAASVQGHANVINLLLQREEIQVCNSDQNGNTPLLLAAHNGHTEAVAALLGKEGIDVNHTESGTFPLLMAAENGHTEVVTALLRKEGIQVNQAYKESGIFPLLMAAEKGHIEVVMALLGKEGIQVNQTDEESGAFPLLLAAQEGHTEVVAALLSKEGIQVNQSNEKSGTFPLLLAAQEGHIEVVTELLGKEGIQVNQANEEDGIFPLLMAAHNGHTEVVMALLGKEGIQVNQTDEERGTFPLLLAAQEGHTEVVAALLRKEGIQVNQTDEESGTFPLLLAAQEGHTEVVTELLGKEGIQVNQAHKESGTFPLLRASQEGHTEVVTALLRKEGIQVNQSNEKSGNFPLLMAALKGHINVVKMLLDKIDINIDMVGTEFDATALMHAVMFNHKAIVSLLLSANRKADPNIISKFHGTALDLALHDDDDDRTEIARMLREFGAKTEEELRSEN